MEFAETATSFFLIFKTLVSIIIFLFVGVAFDITQVLSLIFILVLFCKLNGIDPYD